MVWRSLWMVSWALVVAGCGLDGSERGAEEVTGADDVADVADAAECAPAKLDVLFVIDNTSEMNRAQHALAAAFTDLEGWAAAAGADLHVAVTTVDAQCEPYTGKVTAARGAFNTVPFTALPPGFREREIVRCTTDAECAEAVTNLHGLEPGLPMTCDKAASESCLETPNGSVTSACIYTCEADADCVALTGAADAVCRQAACLVPPPTADCPASVPPVLAAGTLDLARCAMVVGWNVEQCLVVEQPLQAAWMALDPAGPNAAQSAAFLRDDADLVLVFVGNEDDCSIAEGESISYEANDTCDLLGDTREGGPLVPVDDMVARFRSLESETRRVHAIVVNGASTATTQAARDADHAAYVAAKTGERACFVKSYVCNGSLGRADWAPRMMAFAAAFGAHGTFGNICDSGDLGVTVRPPLEDIARWAIPLGCP